MKEQNIKLSLYGSHIGDGRVAEKDMPTKQHI